MKKTVPVQCIRSVFTFPLCDLAADITSGNNTDKEEVELAGQLREHDSDDFTAYSAITIFFKSVLATLLGYNKPQFVYAIAPVRKKIMPAYCKIRD